MFGPAHSLFGQLLKAAQAKHGSRKVKKNNALRDVAKRMGVEEKAITDETEVWLTNNSREGVVFSHI